MSEWNFIVAAYGLTWLVLAGYSVYLLKRHVRARRSFEDARNEGGAG